MKMPSKTCFCERQGGTQVWFESVSTKTKSQAALEKVAWNRRQKGSRAGCATHGDKRWRSLCGHSE